MMMPDALSEHTLRRKSLHIFLVLAAFLLVTFPAWSSFVFYIISPGLLHEEWRILFPYHRYSDPALFEGDYIARYLESGARIYLYDALNYLWAKIFGDLTVFHIYVLPFTLTGLYLCGLFLAAKKTGGTTLAFGALGLSLLQTNILYQISSSLPHGFAFPLLAWTLCALQYKSVRGLTVITLLSAALYPVMTPIIGLAFAWYMLISPGESRGAAQEWPFLKRFGLLALTGIAAIILAYPALPQSGADYGAYLAPGTQTEAYPENDIGGRHFRGTLDPVGYSFISFAKQFMPDSPDDDLLQPGTYETLSLSLGIIIFWLSLFLILLRTENARYRLVKPLIAASLATVVIFAPLMPHMTYRFILYPLHFLFALLLPLAMLKLFERIPALNTHKLVFMAIFIFSMGQIMDSRFPGPMSPYAVTLLPSQQDVVAFAGEKPVDTRFAGWPGATIEVIPYLARRPAHLLYKTHYPLHESYTLEMRERMYALADAYLAADKAPLEKLRDKWDVNYLIVNRYWFDREETAKGRRPVTFKPFDRYVDELWDRNAAAGFFLENPPQDAVVFDEGLFYVLDLSRI